MFETVAFRDLHCPICDSHEFDRVGARLRAMLLQFFDFSLGGLPQALLACHACGHLEWVTPEEMEMGVPALDLPEDEDLDEDNDQEEKDVCFACGMELEHDQTICPACGWSR